MRVRKAIIPAAGLGTRFLPATKVQPKEMLPVVDTPMIQYQVQEILASGITDILIITGKGKHVIEDHFDRSPELESFLQARGKQDLVAQLREISNGADIHYIRQKDPKGLGDAVRCAKSWASNEPFAVLLGDDIMQSSNGIPVTKQLMQLFERYQGSIISVEHVPREKIPRHGIIKPRELAPGLFEVEDIIEKPPLEKAPSDLAVSGRYILTPAIFELLEQTRPGAGGEIQLTDALHALLAREKMYAAVVQARRFDIGTKIDFLKSTVELALARPDVGPEFRAFLQQLLGERGAPPAAAGRASSA